MCLAGVPCQAISRLAQFGFLFMDDGKSLFYNLGEQEL